MVRELHAAPEPQAADPWTKASSLLPIKGLPATFRVLTRSAVGINS